MILCATQPIQAHEVSRSWGHSALWRMHSALFRIKSREIRNSKALLLVGHLVQLSASWGFVPTVDSQISSTLSNLVVNDPGSDASIISAGKQFPRLIDLIVRNAFLITSLIFLFLAATHYSELCPLWPPKTMLGAHFKPWQFFVLLSCFHRKYALLLQTQG